MPGNRSGRKRDINMSPSDLNYNDENFDLSSVSVRGAGRKKRRKIRRIVNIFASIVLCLSVILTALMGTYLSVSGIKINNDTEEEDSNEEFESLTVSSSSGVSYILILGVDPQETLTDIIIVACIDHEKNTLNFLQIPRDTFIGDDVPTRKINAVYGNPRTGEAKINALRRRISSYFGIPLDHYCLFTIKGFINVIDALGGVKIYIEQENGIDIMDPETFKHERIGPGWVTLTGNQATGFVRKRTGTSDGYYKGDIARIEAQRLVYVALAKKLQAMTAGQMFNIAKKCYSEISTDMSINRILGYATEVKSISMENMGVYAVPGQSVTYKGLSMYSPHKDDYITLFNTYFNPYGAAITADDIKMMELHTMLGIAKSKSHVEQGGSLASVNEEKNQNK